MPNKIKGAWNHFGSKGYSSGNDVKLPPKYASSSHHSSESLIAHRMKCCRCDKNKASTTNFSKKEQDRAKEAVQYNSAVPKDLKCITCTTGQNTEMKCVMCDQVKGLDSFAKTHRRNPEQAVRFLEFAIHLANILSEMQAVHDGASCLGSGRISRT